MFIALWAVNTHYISLILQGLTCKGGMPAAGILAGKGATIENLFCTAPKSENTQNLFLQLIRIIERKKHQRGPTPWPGGWGVRPPLLDAPPVSWAPGGPPMSIFRYMKAFTLKKSWGSLRDETPPP